MTEHVVQLPSGLTVAVEPMASTRTVAIGVWVGVGARDEPDGLAGVSHFLEHLLFKGTAERSATDIAFEVDGMGGDMNAYTTSEYTAYHVRVPAPEVDAATDLLLEVVRRPALRPEELEGERGVILEELAAADDDPEDVVGVRLHAALFPDHPLGRDVLGERRTIEALTRERVAGFFDRWYRPANLVVTAAGGIDHDRLVARVAEAFDGVEPGARPVRTPPGDPSRVWTGRHHATDLVHLALGWRIPESLVPDRFALAVANQVLGSGPASRLFQEVRERRALTYSIASGVSLYQDAGTWTLQCSTSPDKAPEVLTVVQDLVRGLAAEGITDEELVRARRSLRGSLLLGLEDSGHRAARLGVAECVRGRYTPVEEHLERLDAVTSESVAHLAREVLGRPGVVSVVAPEGADLAALRGLVPGA